MSAIPMQDQLSTIKAFVRAAPKSSSESPFSGDAKEQAGPQKDSATVTVNYDAGTADIKTGIGTTSVQFGNEDKKELLENAKEMQRAAINERLQSIAHAAALNVLLLQEKEQAIKTAKDTATAILREKRMASWASFGMALLAVITATGAAFALCQGVTGKDNTSL